MLRYLLIVLNEVICLFQQWSKPVMEKRRRERINRSLEELKRLVLQAQNRDVSIMISRIVLRKEEGLKIEKILSYDNFFFFLHE